MKWRQLAGALRWRIEPFIDGRYRPSAAAERFDTVNPATETPLSCVAVGAAADIDAAVRAARTAFDSGRWSQMPPVQRAAVLYKLADLIKANKEELALLDCQEMGKPITAALQDAGHWAPALLRSWASCADKLVGASAPMSADVIQFCAYEPRGVVGAISPWNFPLVNAVYKVGPALAAGNSMVLKPSELASSSALKLAELALEAGVPAGVLNVVPGLGATVGSALARHPDVDMISFTGSSATGRRIMELAGGSNGKPLLLECGGKSPQVVCSDAADLDVVARACAHSALWNQGQVCGAHTRLIVHEHIAEELVGRVAELAGQCRPADPLEESTTFGPLASRAQANRVRRYVEQGIAEGARTVLKGPIQPAGGCFVHPTLFDATEPGMTVVREEIFGPVLCIQRFSTEQQAIALANGTDYGLAATVWTRDMARGRRLAHAIKAGSIAVRTSGPQGPPSGCVLASEPRKASGFGAERGLAGLQSYSALKVITFSGS